MEKAEKRRYTSPVRARQADDTRRRVTEAARKLFMDQGFAATTIDAIAEEAAVASQTVYAIFRSKRGILAEILEQAKFGVTHEMLVNQALSSTDPRERLILAAKIATQIYDSEKNEYALLKAATDMLELDECRRAEAQKPTIELLAKSGQMKSGLKKSEAADIMWMLTGREIYRMLVMVRGWSSTRYESWLGQMLIDSLLSD